MRHTTNFFVLFGAALAWAGCQRHDDDSTTAPSPEVGYKEGQTASGGGTTRTAAHVVREDPGDETSGAISTAVAILSPTEGNSARGSVRFNQTDEGLSVRAELHGLPEGKHAYHIHLFGDCSSSDAKSAGTHFNFSGSSKSPGDVKRITGDLGELVAGADGNASAEGTIRDAKLSGPYSIVGRAVVVHEKGNDPKQPPIGAAGGRLACGAIGIGEP